MSLNAKFIDCNYCSKIEELPGIKKIEVIMDKLKVSKKAQYGDASRESEEEDHEKG